jgi:SnoaL-like domain
VAAVHADKDAARIAEVFTEDIVYDDDGRDAPACGHAELAEFFRSVWTAFPDFRLELVAGPFVSAGSASFAVRGQMTATMTGPLDPPGLAPTNGAVSTAFGGFYEVEGTRVRNARVIMNTYELGIDMGASPPRGSAGERLVVLFQRLQALRLRRLNRQRR